ncbi:UPF0488 protein CG14286 [Episyrphus balteatus]|uniref:UPF0488 protein CG14286 n=1 Tax=Episyrphus balteatus TaxID=286459 RepID=UPI00248587C5|nr:UPF0488 protein CG14286 [Episyrphus balteatus]
MLKMKTAKTLKKTPPIITAPPVRDLDAESQFQLELYWCVQQLEVAIANAKVNKQREDMSKSLKTLKSSTAPVVKKRQIMKASFGDYRSKMKEEEKKLALATRQIKFTSSTDAQNKSSFVKKAAILTSGKDFKFNFNPDTSSVDTQATEKETKENESVATTTAPVANNINFSSGGGFKFNFDIESNNEHIDFEKLSIKS